MTRANHRDVIPGWPHFRDTVLKSLVARIPGAKAAVRAAKIAFNPDYRSVWRLQRERPDNLFQPYSDTFPNRHPDIFGFVGRALVGAAELRILSFGCSKGDEVFTLRRYFPRAALTGIDINPRNIRICRRRGRKIGDDNIRFVQAADAEGEASESYDAIFCMSVFRHGDLAATNASTCGHLIRFADFERALEVLDRCLKPGGYLCLRHGNFRFRDTVLAGGYDTAFSLSPQRKRSWAPLYDRDNRRLPDPVYYDVVFRKRASSSPDHDPLGGSRGDGGAVEGAPAIVERALIGPLPFPVPNPHSVAKRFRLARRFA